MKFIKVSLVRWSEGYENKLLENINEFEEIDEIEENEKLDLGSIILVNFDLYYFYN